MSHYKGSYGAQAIQRLLDDSAALAHEYDEFADNTEDPHLKHMLSRACIRLLKNINDASTLWSLHPGLKSLPRPAALEPPDEEGFNFSDDDDHYDPDEPSPWSDLEEEERRNGPDPRIRYLDEAKDSGDTSVMEGYFHKAMESAADFLRGLGIQMGTDSEEQEDEENPSPLKEKRRKSFDPDSQMEARRRASDLDQYSTKLKDPEILNTIKEVIDLLNGLVDSRQKRDSTDGLEPFELDAIDKQEKALRSILTGRRGRWPKGDMYRTGQKSLSIDSIAEDTARQTKAIESLQSELDRLERLI